MNFVIKGDKDTVGYYVSIEKLPDYTTLFSLDYLGFCTHWYYKENEDFGGNNFIIGVDDVLSW